LAIVFTCGAIAGLETLTGAGRLVCLGAGLGAGLLLDEDFFVAIP